MFLSFFLTLFFECRVWVFWIVLDFQKTLTPILLIWVESVTGMVLFVYGWYFRVCSGLVWFFKCSSYLISASSSIWLGGLSGCFSYLLEFGSKKMGRVSRANNSKSGKESWQSIYYIYAVGQEYLQTISSEPGPARFAGRAGRSYPELLFVCWRWGWIGIDGADQVVSKNSFWSSVIENFFRGWVLRLVSGWFWVLAAWWR